MKTKKELKTCARGSLLGHYKTAIAALLFSQLIILLINMPFNNMTQQGIVYMVPSRIALGAIGSFIIALLAFLLKFGVIQIHLRIARRQETGFRDLFLPFQNRPDKFLGYGALILIVTLVCILPGLILMLLPFSGTVFLLTGCGLCLAGCVIAVILLLSWALTPYLMLDDPDLSVPNAMKKSRSLMCGNKGKLFLLLLSFLGWILFSVLSFGLALLWVIPYMTQAVTWFYLDFVPEQKTADSDTSI